MRVRLVDAARRVRPRRRRALGGDAGDASRGALGNAALNRLASYLTGATIPDLTSGFRAARRELPARVPPPAAQRLLDADDDDAGVHQGGLQRGVRADRGARSASGTSKIRLARDGAKFLLIILRDHHDLQPAARLPADQPSRRSRSAPATRVWTIVDAVARHQLVGAADHAGGRRLPRRPGLRADLGAALRWPAVDRAPAARSSLARGGRRRWSLRLAFGLGYWVDKPLDARRARVPVARAQPRRRPRVRLRRRVARTARSSRSAARPATRCSSRSSAAARGRPTTCRRASRSRSRSSARSASC